MGFWSKAFGGETATAGSGADKAPSLTAPSPGTPTSVAAIGGKLQITFYAHDTLEGARGNFISAVTNGYRKYGQGELVLTLRLHPDDDVPAKLDDVRRFFSAVHAWAREGHLTTAGGVTRFGERAPFGRSQSGVLYAAARPIAGIEIPRGALAAMLVDAAEVRTALDYGAYRVLTRLGEQYRHFPFPTWSDLERSSVVGPREGETLLAKMARTRAPGASFLVEDERVRVLLAPSVQAVVGRGIAELPAGAPFALLVQPAKGANAVLVWHPGQKEPLTISPDGSDGSRTTGSCLVVAPGQPEDRGRMIEDGYSLRLSPKSWASITAALLQQRPVSVSLAEGIRLSFEWQPDEPANQMD